MKAVSKGTFSHVPLITLHVIVLLAPPPTVDHHRCAKIVPVTAEQCLSSRSHVCHPDIKVTLRCPVSCSDCSPEGADTGAAG